MSMRQASRLQRPHDIFQARAYNNESSYTDDMRSTRRLADFENETSDGVADAQSQKANEPKDSQTPIRREERQFIDVKALLSKPSWSVRSLLPGKVPPADEITPEKLHHLLRLSALPLPRSKDRERKMLDTLHSQLHFVRDIQKVNTDGVEPLRAIRDETESGIKDITIGMKDLKEAFDQEDIVGQNKRPRRKRVNMVGTKGAEDWDVLGSASETVEMNGASYFVVRKSDGGDGQQDYSEQQEDKASVDTIPKNE